MHYFVVMVTLCALIVAPVFAADATINQLNSQTEACLMKKIVAEIDPIMAGGPPFRRLFLDAMVVEESQGLKRQFHAASRYPGNPVLQKEKEWEGWGPCIGGTVLKDGDKLRMYYYCIGGGPQSTGACVAESYDGIHWTRPNVGEIEWNGSKDNNMTVENGSVLKLANPESPDRKFLLFGFSPELGTHMMYSGDGLHWKLDEKAVKLFSTGDAVMFFYDPYQKRFVSTWKSLNRRHRAVGVAWSEDGLVWEKPFKDSVFCADDHDPDATQIYAMPAFPYQGMYVGLPFMYHARWLKYGKYSSPQVMYEAQEDSPRTMDVQMSWSHDLVHWNRTSDRKPFISTGKPDAFDSNMIITAREPVVMGDKLYFYYGGFSNIHDDDANGKCAIGLATLRLDGFCSMQAGKNEGWLISRREIFNTPKITINAKCAKNGYVTADIVDRNDNVIKGYSRDECMPFTGDSVRGVLTWKKSFAKDLIDKDKKIRFYIKNADLYSYLPVDINQEIDDSHPDW